MQWSSVMVTVYSISSKPCIRNGESYRHSMAHQLLMITSSDHIIAFTLRVGRLCTRQLPCPSCALANRTSSHVSPPSRLQVGTHARTRVHAHARARTRTHAHDYVIRALIITTANVFAASSVMSALRCLPNSVFPRCQVTLQTLQPIAHKLL